MDLKVEIHFKYFSTGITVINLLVSTKFGIFLANSPTTNSSSPPGQLMSLKVVHLFQPSSRSLYFLRIFVLYLNEQYVLPNM